MGIQYEGVVVLLREIYYRDLVILMLLTPIGLLFFKLGMTSKKHRIATLTQNLMLMPVSIISFFLFGWFFYKGFEFGPGITGGWGESGAALPWSEFMATNLNATPDPDNLINTSIPWHIFLLFSIIVVSIAAGSWIERIRGSALCILSVILGSVFWVIAAAWGWSESGWLVELVGYHDPFAGGVIHCLVGGFALGVLLPLGPRLGKQREIFDVRKTIHNPWMLTLGMLMIYAGFLSFYFAAQIPLIKTYDSGNVIITTNIYGAPTTMYGTTFNYFLSLAGGMMMGFILSRGNLFWILGGGLTGLVSTSAGNDLYHPLQAFLISVFVVWLVFRTHHWIERRFRIDDITGVVAIHGFGGFFGLIISGFILWGYPSSPNLEFADINPAGQAFGAMLTFWLFGFFPGYLGSQVLEFFDVLRIPEDLEIGGQDTLSIKKQKEDIAEFAGIEKAVLKEIIEERNN
ncbi:MAG: ammonium transporter [SAR202 cluster bacterium]|nr:ammonium transporter [SAR202 cluster bacterium]